MSNRTKSWVAASALIVHSLYSPAALSAQGESARSGHPNLIVIVADDMGYADVGFTTKYGLVRGPDDIPTPNIDRLASEGVRFRQGYVTHPFCSPSRAALMTGRYQARFGHDGNPRFDVKDVTEGMDLKEITLPQVLKSAGYTTGGFGKWHLGSADARLLPENRGFDLFYGFHGGGHQYHSQFTTGGKSDEYRTSWYRNEQQVTEPEHATRAIAREAIAFIDKNKDKPFFAYVAFNAPHTPLQPDDASLTKLKGIPDEKRRQYAGLVVGMDVAVGQILDALRANKLNENTLVVFFSDNGGERRVSAGNNGSLRGQKGQLYEGGIRTPMVFRWTGNLAANTEFRAPVIATDIFTTFVDVAGAKLPEGVKLDGVNLMPFIQPSAASKEPPQRMLFWRNIPRAFAVRDGRWKLVLQNNEPREDATLQLYDIEADPEEKINLVAEQPAVVKRLKAAFVDWEGGTVPGAFGMQKGKSMSPVVQKLP